MQCPEHEGLHGRPILQTEMAGAGGSKHAGDPIELLPPPAGEPLQLRRIEETILSRVHAGLLLAAGEILRARDVGLAVPEAAEDGGAQRRRQGRLLGLHSRLQQQGGGFARAPVSQKPLGFCCSKLFSEDSQARCLGPIYSNCQSHSPKALALMRLGALALSASPYS